MPKTITVLRILVASPSDLEEERKLLDGVIQELNLILLQQRGISFELIKWETHTFPGVGTDAQDVINHQLPIDYDILLSMFWSRIGTPTPRSKSGTLEEFENAYRRWNLDPHSIRLMIYFKTAPISPDFIDPDQLRQVKEFRNSLNEKGVKYATFASNEEFSQLLRLHLNWQAQDFLKVNEIKNKSNKIPITAYINQETQEDKSIEISEDEGFLDLIEITETAFQRASEVTKHITDGLEKFTAGTNQSSLDLKSVDGDEKAKFAAYKRISNRQAENMADFVARMHPETPILDDSISKALDAYGRILSLLSDFGSNANNHSQLESALSAAANLRNVMVTSKESIERFRSSTAALPRVTTQFNRSRRDLLSLLDLFLGIYSRGINLLGEIEVTGNSILNSRESLRG